MRGVKGGYVPIIAIARASEDYIIRILDRKHKKKSEVIKRYHNIVSSIFGVDENVLQKAMEDDLCFIGFGVNSNGIYEEDEKKQTDFIYMRILWKQSDMGIFKQQIVEREPNYILVEQRISLKSNYKKYQEK